MSPGSSPRYARIGAFVAGAVAILVTALVFIGGGKLFSEQKKFVAYFSGSVKGLTVGAPVNFRGARVGSVVDVAVVYDEKSDQLTIPVTFEIDPSSIKGAAPVTGPADSGAPMMERLISRGLRAQLALESLVTGQLYVLLDFFPEAPPRYSAQAAAYPEVPTVESSFEKLKVKLEEIPIHEISSRLQKVLERVDAFLEKGELTEAVADFRALTSDLTRLVANIDERTNALTLSIDKFAQDGGRAFSQARATLGALEGARDPAELALRQLRGTLDEISASARSLRRLTDTLERQPESLIRGKGD